MDVTDYNLMIYTATDLSSVVRIELLGPKAKHPLEKSLRHFVSKDPRLLYLFFFISIGWRRKRIQFLA